MSKQLSVKAHISIPLTTPDCLVTPNGTKLPLWVVSDEDLRLIATEMAAELIVKANRQREAAMLPPSH